MSYVFRRPDSRRYWVGYKDELGQPRRIPTKAITKTEALRIAAELERDAELVRLKLKTFEVEVVFREAVARYLSIEAVSRKSYSDIEGRFRNHLLPLLGDLLLSQITPAMVQGALAKKAAEGLAPQTLRHLRNHLNAFFNFCIKRAKLLRGENPILEVPQIEVPQREPTCLPLEEVLATMKALSSSLRCMVAVDLGTGVRKGELCGLLVRNIHLTEGYLLVEGSYGDSTKNQKIRYVPMPRWIVPFIREALDRAAMLKSQWLFPKDDGSMRTRHFDAAGMFKRALKKAGVVQGYLHKCRRPGCGYSDRREDSVVSACPKCKFKLWVTPIPKSHKFKDLRSTFGTLAYEKTGNIRFVQRVLGHHDPKLTEKVYAKQQIKHLVEEANKLEFVSHDLLTSGFSGRSLPESTGELSPANSGSLTNEGYGARTRDLRRDRPKEHLAPIGTESPPVESARPERAQNSGQFAPISTESSPLTHVPLTVIADRLLTVAKAAAMLGLKPPNLYRHLNRGNIPCVRIGSAVRVREADLLSILRGDPK